MTRSGELIKESMLMMADIQEEFDEQLVLLYPFRIKMDFSVRNVNFDMEPLDIRINKVETWLRENIDKDSYIAFPNERYMQYCFFNNEDDAILFKLTWT